MILLLRFKLLTDGIESFAKAFAYGPALHFLQIDRVPMRYKHCLFKALKILPMIKCCQFTNRKSGHRDHSGFSLRRGRRLLRRSLS